MYVESVKQNPPYRVIYKDVRPVEFEPTYFVVFVRTKTQGDFVRNIVNRHYAPHRHFVAVWMGVKNPAWDINKKWAIPRKRDAVNLWLIAYGEDVVPYGHETNFVRTCYPVYTMFVVFVIHTQSRFCRGRRLDVPHCEEIF